jgi:ABC-type sulfate transport system permease component
VFFAGTAILLWMAATRTLGQVTGLSRRKLAQVAAQGALLTLNWVLFLSALDRTSVATAELLGYDPAMIEATEGAGTQTIKLRGGMACLGATRWQTFRWIIFPAVRPALLTGFTLAFARCIGEYGSVIFIAGNLPMVSEITPLLIVTKLEQYDYRGATAIAVVMLVISFLLLLLINLLQWWSRQRHAI